MTEEKHDLVPLFSCQVGSDTQPALPTVKQDGEECLPSSLISSVAEEISDEVGQLLAGERAGELTIAAYILLESLHRASLQSVATSLLSEPTLLRQAALYCAIGLAAGRRVPEEVEIGTRTIPDNPHLWLLSGGEDQDSAPGEDEECPSN